MNISKTTKKYLLFVAKVLITLVAWWYIYDKVIVSAKEFKLIDFSSINIFVICIVFLFIFLNWSIEAKKWQLLILQIQYISFLKALRGTLIGITIGFITPNRIGDIGGRSVVLEHGKKQAMIATTIGSIIQFLATIIFGLLGIVLFLILHPVSQTIQSLFIASVSIVIVTVFVFQFTKNQKFISAILFRILGFRKYKKFRYTLREYPLRVLLKTLFLSCLRYAVFSIQYILLLHVFVSNLELLNAIIGVTITYLFVTIIPSSILGEVGVRGSVSVFVFGLFGAEASPIFQVSLLMWTINLAFPVLVGSSLFLMHKLRK